MADANTPALHKNNFYVLRILFASMVILSHAPELRDGSRQRELLTCAFHTISFGELGVDGFFVLSGYLIAQSWQRNPKLLDFLIKRVLRIYPGYVAAGLVCLLLVGPLGAQNVSAYWHNLHPLRFARDTLLLHPVATPPTFVGLPHPSVNGSLWTIKFEFRCYLLVALLGVCGLLQKRGTVLILAAGLMGGYMYQCQRIGLLPAQPTLLRLATFFVAGMCFHLFADYVRYTRRGAMVAGLVLCGCLFHPLLSQIALLTCGAYLLFGAAFSHAPRLQQLGTRADVSYGMYLYAWPVSTLLLWHYRSMSPVLLFVLTWVASALCGLVSWHGIERPFLRWKPRVKEETPPPSTSNV